MSRMEDLNVKICQEAIICKIITCKIAFVSEGGKTAQDPQSRCWLEASAGHRDAAIAGRHDDCRHHESNRMAAAFGARLSCWRGAQASETEACLEQGERQPDLSDRGRRKRQHSPTNLIPCHGSGSVRRCRTETPLMSRLRACAISTSQRSAAVGIPCSGGERRFIYPVICCFGS